MDLTPKKIIREIRGVFKLPKKQYYLGKQKYGTPYFWPRNYNRKVISVRKLKISPDYNPERDKYPAKKFSNMPMALRSKYWISKIMGSYYFIEVGWPIKLNRNTLGWKDKFESPRFEWTPTFQIFFFGYQFCIFWNSPDGNNDRYYEMILWWLNYSDKDIIKAEKNWGWEDYKTKKSSWDKKYLIK